MINATWNPIKRFDHDGTTLTPQMLFELGWRKREKEIKREVDELVRISFLAEAGEKELFS